MKFETSYCYLLLINFQINHYFMYLLEIEIYTFENRNNDDFIITISITL